MNFAEMTVSEMEARLSAIATEIEADDADLDALEEETRGIRAEMDKRKADEAKRNEIRSAVANGKGEEIKTFEEKGNKTMTIEEYRNSKEYSDLYAEYMKSHDDTDIRAALLTVNADNGTIPVPGYVYDIVKTAWDRNDIMSLVNRVSLPGNLAVQFEISGTPAVIHAEGSGAVEEEELVEGIVTIIPEYAKKWKSFSKTVYSLRGEAFVRYIYDEITYRIIKAIADNLIGQIADLPAVATATSPAAVTITGAPAMGLIAEAIGNLSDEATNPVIVMNKGTWAAFKAAQYAGQFNADPFEGLSVHFNNSLPAYSAATSDDVYAIVGDFREGAIANFPNGENVEFTFDTLSRKKENLVEVLGELMVGTAPVTNYAFCLIAKAGE